MTDTKTPAREPEPTQECIDQELPIKQSMAGYNAYYLHCDVYQGRSNYAVCQHTIDAVKEERVQLRSECPNAINCGTCPALKMREREKEAGRAMFFIDRRETMKKLREEIEKGSSVVSYGKNRRGAEQPLVTRRVSETEAREFAEKMKTTVTKSPDKPKKSEPINVELVGSNLLGDAIQKMMGEKSD